MDVHEKHVINDKFTTVCDFGDPRQVLDGPTETRALLCTEGLVIVQVSCFCLVFA